MRSRQFNAVRKCSVRLLIPLVLRHYEISSPGAGVSHADFRHEIVCTSYPTHTNEGLPWILSPRYDFSLQDMLTYCVVMFRSLAVNVPMHLVPAKIVACREISTKDVFASPTKDC